MRLPRDEVTGRPGTGESVKKMHYCKMEERMNKYLALGCLVIMLCLSACGSGLAGNSSTAAPDVTEKTEAPIVTEPAAPPENPVQAAAETAAPAPEAPSQDANSGEEAGVVVQEEAVPVQAAEPPAPAVETPPVQEAGQNQESASGQFTGVMGTEFVIPDGFVQIDQIPNIGYQYTFWHPDYEIRIEVAEIAPGYLPEHALETDYDTASGNPNVTYLNKGENWFVQSGYNHEDEIFYIKESSVDGELKSFTITYPTAKREFGDSITAEFEKNCRF